MAVAGGEGRVQCEKQQLRMGFAILMRSMANDNSVAMVAQCVVGACKAIVTLSGRQTE